MVSNFYSNSWLKFVFIICSNSMLNVQVFNNARALFKRACKMLLSVMWANKGIIYVVFILIMLAFFEVILTMAFISNSCRFAHTSSNLITTG